MVHHTPALSCSATASSEQTHNHTGRHHSYQHQGVPTTLSEPPTMQARRSAGGSTSADATKEQSATLPTSAGSQAVVETTPPRPAHVLHQWPRELTPLYNAQTCTSRCGSLQTRKGDHSRPDHRHSTSCAPLALV